MQKKAYWLKVPCLTLGDEKEWVETVDLGLNVLVGSESGRILKAMNDAHPGSSFQDVYGDGEAAERIVHLISSI